MILVHGQVCLVLCSVEHAKTCFQDELEQVHFMSEFIESSEGDRFEPSNLTAIHRFCLAARSIHDQQKMLVICTGHDMQLITHYVLLLGAFLIIELSFDIDEVQAALQPLSHTTMNFSDDLTIEDCLRAVRHAKEIGWLDFHATFENESESESVEPKDRSSIDIDEYIHYDSPLNGNLHVLVPNKLLVFPRPEDIPDDQPWADVDGVRHFGPAYFADLFGDFNVQLVVSPTCSSYSIDAFAERGIEVEDLDFDDEGEEASLLQKIDRFLTLTRCTPGTIAVHGGTEGLGLATTLIAAYLMKAHHFGAKAAVAWICMVHPSVMASGHQEILLDNEGHPSVMASGHQQFLLDKEGVAVRKRHSMPGFSSKEIDLGDPFSGPKTLSRSFSQPNVFDFALNQ